MINAIRRISGNLRKANGGNAAMLVALGMPVLIGGAGLAVDTAQWYMWKRELQHSVDQAALGAAFALSNEKSEQNFETRAMQEFNVNQSKTEGFSATPTIRLANFAGGTDNSVIVSASATKALPFSSMVMGSSATINVSAQASFRPGISFNACLVALAEDESDVLNIGGNANIQARCGLAALSCEDDAITIDGSATVETDSIATCGTVDVPEENQDVVSEGVEGLEDIYKDLVPPEVSTEQENTCKGKGKSKYAELYEGTYKGGITVKCDTVLNSGVYVIDGGSLDLTGNYSTIGNKVLFILKNGAEIKFGGSGNSNQLNLTPMEADDFIGKPYAGKAEDFQNVLVFEIPNEGLARPDHQINGNSDTLMEGLIYLPSGEIKINGTGKVSAQCLQISAWKIRVLGTADLETLCPTEDTTSVGSAIADVRLVA